MSVSAGADECLTTDWLNTFPPRPLWPRDHSICSVLAARPLTCSRGMRAQRGDTSEVVPGSENSGDHTSLWPQGKRPGEIRGQGQPANKGPLAFSWKKITEKDQVRAPNSPTPHHNTHAYSEYREAPSTFCL